MAKVALAVEAAVLLFFSMMFVFFTTTRMCFEEVGSVLKKAGCSVTVQSINTLTFPYVNCIPG